MRLGRWQPALKQKTMHESDPSSDQRDSDDEEEDEDEFRDEDRKRHSRHAEYSSTKRRRSYNSHVHHNHQTHSHAHSHHHERGSNSGKVPVDPAYRAAKRRVLAQKKAVAAEHLRKHEAEMRLQDERTYPDKLAEYEANKAIVEGAYASSFPANSKQRIIKKNSQAEKKDWMC